MELSFDELDLELIRILQDEPRASYATMSRLTGASESTVKRRVEGLIASGVVTPAMVPDIYLLGFRARAFIGVRVELSRMAEVAARIRELPAVTFLVMTMGRFDLMFFVAEPTLEDLTRFVLEQVATIEGVKETETLVAPHVLKVIGDWRLPSGVDGSSSSRAAGAKGNQNDISGSAT